MREKSFNAGKKDLDSVKVNDKQEKFKRQETLKGHWNLITLYLLQQKVQAKHLSLQEENEFI